MKCVGGQMMEIGNLYESHEKSPVHRSTMGPKKVTGRGVVVKKRERRRGDEVSGK